MQVIQNNTVCVCKTDLCNKDLMTAAVGSPHPLLSCLLAAFLIISVTNS